jgi:acyl-CoA synthetase (AMP-forming)/AMP-acid ligase II
MAPREASGAARPSLLEVLRAVAGTVGDRTAVVDGPVRRTYAQLVERVDALGAYLVSRGLGGEVSTEVIDCQTRQGRVALYLHNGTEFVEAFFGSLAARLAPFNVNYRYTATELSGLFDDAAPCVVVYHSAFAGTLSEVLLDLDTTPVLIQVPDDSGNALLPGAVWFECAATSEPDVDLPGSSGDDVVLVYTGGTTGMPKGVMWRNHDLWIGACGGAALPSGITATAMGTLVETIPGPRALAAAPFMHGAGLWFMIRALMQGGLVAIPETVTRFDAAQSCELIERERLDFVPLVAEAFANPLVRHLAEKAYDLDCVTFVGLGGGITTAKTKAALMAAMPNAELADSAGSSETGGVLRATVLPGDTAESGVFALSPRACVVSADKTRLLEPGAEEQGWLGARAPLPLGYLNDPVKSAATFIEVGGDRIAITGDRAQLLDDGRLRLLGRDSVTINSGGEKVFAEEVERAARLHPHVRDVIVVGRPHWRWGEEVVAVIALHEPVTHADLLEVMSTHIARYKLPKSSVEVSLIPRSPAGKPDYRWAKLLVTNQIERTI